MYLKHTLRGDRLRSVAASGDGTLMNILGGQGMVQEDKGVNHIQIQTAFDIVKHNVPYVVVFLLV